MFQLALRFNGGHCQGAVSRGRGKCVPKRVPGKRFYLLPSQGSVSLWGGLITEPDFVAPATVKKWTQRWSPAWSTAWNCNYPCSGCKPWPLLGSWTGRKGTVRGWESGDGWEQREQCWQELSVSKRLGWMSKAGVYSLRGLLWVRALCNVTQSHPIPEWGFTKEEGNSGFEKTNLHQRALHQSVLGLPLCTWGIFWDWFLAAPAVWVFVTENNRAKQNPDPIK